MTKTFPNQKHCLSTFYFFPISFLHHDNAKMSNGNIMLQFPFLLEKVGHVFNKKQFMKKIDHILTNSLINQGNFFINFY